jgi:RNA recognition motif-containing protein
MRSSALRTFAKTGRTITGIPRTVFAVRTFNLRTSTNQVRTFGEDTEQQFERPRRPRQDRGNTVFIRNIAFKTSEDELRDYFAAVGDVVNVRIPTDRDTQRPRGFAFVQFSNAEDVSKALQMDGSELNGRQIFVTVSQDKSN